MLGQQLHHHRAGMPAAGDQAAERAAPRPPPCRHASAAGRSGGRSRGFRASLTVIGPPAIDGADRVVLEIAARGSSFTMASRRVREVDHAHLVAGGVEHGAAEQPAVAAVARVAGRAGVDHQSPGRTGAPPGGGCGRRARNRRPPRRSARARALLGVDIGAARLPRGRVHQQQRLAAGFEARAVRPAGEPVDQIAVDAGPGAGALAERAEKASPRDCRGSCAPRARAGSATTSLEKRYSQMLSPRQISSSISPISAQRLVEPACVAVNVRDDAEFHCRLIVRARSCRARGFVKAEFALPSLASASHASRSRGGFAMAIVLDHTIVPAHDKIASAEFFARIFGLEYRGPHSHFAPVQVNDGADPRFRRARRSSSRTTTRSRSARRSSTRSSAGSRTRASPTAAARARAPTGRSIIVAAAGASISTTRTATSSKC